MKKQHHLSFIKYMYIYNIEMKMFSHIMYKKRVLISILAYRVSNNLNFKFISVINITK